MVKLHGFLFIFYSMLELWLRFIPVTNIPLHF